MKFKTPLIIGTTVLLSATVLGCGTQAVTAGHFFSPISLQTDAQAATRLWNTSKDRQLNKFMNQWAPTMGQSYTKYDGHHDLKISTGVRYPSGLKKTTVNSSNDSIGWNPKGKGTYDYNVVALYNDNTRKVEGHITYAFAFHKGQPVALVDQSTNGTPNWTPTKNTDVQGNFAKIAKGGKANFSGQKQATSTTTSVDDKTTGVMAALLVNPNWFKDTVKDGEMYYGTTADAQGFGKDLQGYSFVTADGDPTSYIYYKTDGNNVTIKQWEPGKESVADGHFSTTTVTLSRLKNDYYVSQSQKSEVQGYVNKLQPYADANK